MHLLVQEIRYHPLWLRWRETNPMQAINFLNKIEVDLNWQWENFLFYQELKRKEPRTEMSIADGRETAVMPEVYQRWMNFLKPEGMSTKEYSRVFIKNHPELWLHGYKWRGA